MTTTEQTKSNAIVEAIASELGGSTYTNRSGDLCTTIRSGSKRVVVRGEGDGAVHVVLDIDYGVYGSSWCGSNGYKTTAGALRYARRFLGVAA